MFGYIKTDTPNMYVKDTVLYKSVYCGLCKSIGCSCGTRCRFALNYDLTFLSAFLHNVCNVDFNVKKQRCLIHWIIKRPVAEVTELSKKVACLNVILAHYKLVDDFVDNKKGRIKNSFINKGYKKALKSEPKLDEIVKSNYQKLRELENQKCDSIDMICDPFGNIIKDVIKELSGEYFTQELEILSYHIGKWIYLIDAVDDYEKDVKKKNYNVFHYAFPLEKTKKEFLDKNKKEIITIFSYILGTINELCGRIKYNFNHDLTDNILLKGLSQQTKTILEIK